MDIAIGSVLHYRLRQLADLELSLQTAYARSHVSQSTYDAYTRQIGQIAKKLFDMIALGFPTEMQLDTDVKVTIQNLSLALKAFEQKTHPEGGGNVR